MLCRKIFLNGNIVKKTEDKLRKQNAYKLKKSYILLVSFIILHGER